jgi:ubiquinone/menaquinone biosynthesis C-methylase UbiE
MSTATPSYRSFTGTSAENYQRFFVPTIATPVSAALLRAAALQEGERVLDVACGTGVVTRLAAERVGATGAVTAVDVSAEMIDVAKSVSASAGAPIDWHVRDAASLDLAAASFDVALCQMGLMFMEDRRAALAEMHRVLVDGGRVAVNTPGAIQPAFALMERTIVEHVDPALGAFVGAVFSMHDPGAVAALLRDAGFRDVAADVTTTRLVLPEPLEFFWQYIGLTPMASIVSAAPEPAKAAMERQIVDGWSPFVVDGKTVVDQPMVVASGRR